MSFEMAQRLLKHSVIFVSKINLPCLQYSRFHRTWLEFLFCCHIWVWRSFLARFLPSARRTSTWRGTRWSRPEPSASAGTCCTLLQKQNGCSLWDLNRGTLYYVPGEFIIKLIMLRAITYHKGDFRFEKYIIPWYFNCLMNSLVQWQLVINSLFASLKEITIPDLTSAAEYEVILDSVIIFYFRQRCHGSAAQSCRLHAAAVEHFRYFKQLILDNVSIGVEIYVIREDVVDPKAEFTQCGLSISTRGTLKDKLLCGCDVVGVLGPITGEGDQLEDKKILYTCFNYRRIRLNMA